MKRIIALLMLAALLLCICACTKQEPFVTDETAETDEVIEYYKTDVEINEIETPYGKLNYPAEWVDSVDVTTSEEGENFRVIFKAVYGEIVAPMYDIVFGTCETGFKIGALPYKDSSVEVYCDDYTLEGMEMVPEEFSEDYSIKCEDLNVIISHLVYDHGMIVN